MNLKNKITLIEELSANSHPAFVTQLYDGWILRAANAYSGRSSSVFPLYESTLPIDEKLRHCEKFYANQNLMCRFKMTKANAELDEILQGKGYTIITPTHIMTADISRTAYEQFDAEVAEYADEEWFAAYFTFSKYTDASTKSTGRKIYTSIASDTLFAKIKRDGKVAACGFCVIERGYVGLYSIVVDEAARRSGLGFQLCSSLLHHAKMRGADNSYLQVVQSNTAAVNLYQKLGYTHLYDYWYRGKDVTK